MIAPPRRRARLRAGLLAALLCCYVLGFAAPFALAAEPVVAYTDESIGQFEKQLAAGEIAEVTINKYLRSLRTTLKNGQHVLAKYGKKQEPRYEALIKAHGVPVKVLTPAAAKAERVAKPVHHKLRYIAAGVLVVIVAIVGLVLFANRRRRALLED